MKWVFSPHMVVVSSFYLSQNRQAQCSQRSRFSLWLSTKTRAEWLFDPSCIIYGRDGLIEALLESHWAADQLKDFCANKSPALSWFQIGRVGTHTDTHSHTPTQTPTTQWASTGLIVVVLLGAWQMEMLCLLKDQAVGYRSELTYETSSFKLRHWLWVCLCVCVCVRMLVIFFKVHPCMKPSYEQSGNSFISVCVYVHH